MILICEECGKKYRTKGTLKKDKVSFKCRSCSHVITITRADVLADHADAVEISDFQSVLLPDSEEAFDDTTGSKIPPDDFLEPDAVRQLPEGDLPPPSLPAAVVEPPSRKGMGLRIKMMFLFLVVPMALFGMAGAYYLMQMKNFADTLTSESTAVVTKMGEDNIREIARLVADQCKQYLLTHPELSEKEFINDPDFRKMSVQQVGLTGYTALYSAGPFTTWTHPNRRILGKPLLPIMRDPLGKEFNRFVKIVEEIEKGNNVENSGYYLWQDPDGALREKFMFVTPLEGTKYGVAATVYLDEFIRPIKKVERRAVKNTQVTRNTILATIGTMLLLMAVTVFFYAHRITGRIQTLTDLAERISVGDMDAEIKIGTSDEIGKLGEAIDRMQDSIRLSIERLRRRR